MGFFLLLFMVIVAIARLRFLGNDRMDWMRYSVVGDVIHCVTLISIGELWFASFGLMLALFSAMYYRVYFVSVVAVYAVILLDFYIGGMIIAAGLVGLFLGLWDRERLNGLALQANQAGRYYDLERVQAELMAATARIERMTVVSERARISREIHDNAGHEIIAAYMSLQTARELFAEENSDIQDALVLYDDALIRLDSGVNKIREAVHNLAPVATLGVESLRETCEKYPRGKVDFHIFGGTAHVPVHVWSVLDACVNETLTNAVRHAGAGLVNVTLDVTPHIARLCVENALVGRASNSERHTNNGRVIGNGLRNLRHRASAVGGSLSVDSGEVFRVVCVIPIA